MDVGVQNRSILFSTISDNKTILKSSDSYNADLPTIAENIDSEEEDEKTY